MRSLQVHSFVKTVKKIKTGGIKSQWGTKINSGEEHTQKNNNKIKSEGRRGEGRRARQRRFLKSDIVGVYKFYKFTYRFTTSLQIYRLTASLHVYKFTTSLQVYNESTSLQVYNEFTSVQGHYKFTGLQRLYRFAGLQRVYNFTKKYICLQGFTKLTN